MKEEDIFRIVHLIITIGIIFILLGTTIELEEVIKDNAEKQEIIDRQAEELIKCKAENEHLWNNYYENVSNYNGEYYE